MRTFWGHFQNPPSSTPTTFVRSTPPGASDQLAVYFAMITVKGATLSTFIIQFSKERAKYAQEREKYEPVFG